MKVESVEAFPVRLRVHEDLRGGSFSYSHYETVLVRAFADGVEGWGEAMTRFDPASTALMVRYLGLKIGGKGFEGVRGAWESLWRELRVRGHTRGVDVEALSGIEIALWDAVGRARNRPLWSFFTKEPFPEVPVFAGSLFASRGPIGDQVETAQELGLLGAKVKVGFGVEKDRKMLAGVRRLWPDGMLVADANGAYDAAAAKKACRAFAGIGLAWFEEPVLSDDMEGYSALRESGVRIGAGESWFAGDFARPIEENLVGVIEPSVSRCGGLAVEVQVADRAAAKGIGFSPMTGMNSALSLAASLHAAASRASLGVEYNPFVNPLQTELAAGLAEPRQGKIRVPTGPGLGVEVDPRFVKKHSRWTRS